MSSLCFHVDPRDAPASVAARRLGLTEAQFTDKLPELCARDFPRPDDTTGLFDLDAIDEWRRRRHPQLFLTATEQARDGKAVEALAGGADLGGIGNKMANSLAESKALQKVYLPKRTASVRLIDDARKRGRKALGENS